jgi:hypothetical protein
LRTLIHSTSVSTGRVRSRRHVTKSATSLV